MSLTYKELASELVGHLPDLPFPAAQRFINRAYRDIRDYYSWSFLLEEGTLEVPDSVTAGTMGVEQGSATFTLDATADAVWNALGMFIPVTSRQVKVGNALPYNILTYDGVSSGTFDRVYSGATDAAITYTLYRAYYAAPSDFVRWVSIVDPVNGYTLIRSRSKQWLDNIDPQRSSLGGPAIYIASYKYGTVSGVQTPFYELWPAPTAAATLMTLYKRRGVDFSADTDVAPAVISDDIIIQRGLYYGYQYAATNAGRVAAWTRVRWGDLIKTSLLAYKEALADAVRQDDSTMMQSIIGRQIGWPYDSNYLQSHLSPGEYRQAFYG